MKSRPMGLARIQQRSFDRAGKLENRRFGGGTVCLYRLLSSLVFPPGKRVDSGGLRQVVSSTPVPPTPRAPLTFLWGVSPGAIFS